MKGLIDVVNELISLEELNLLAVSHVPINQSCNDRIVEVDMKKPDRKYSETIVKVSMVNKR